LLINYLSIINYLKDRRRRPEGGEWERIKISCRNLTYISKSTRRPSLLTRPRPHSYSKVIDLQNRVRNRNRTLNGASKTTCEIDDKIWIEEQFISSQAFHRTPGLRVREINVEVQFRLENLESFDPVTQEHDRLPPACIHTQMKDQQSFYWLTSNSTNTWCT
jgi:hypothetical protein